MGAGTPPAAETAIACTSTQEAEARGGPERGEVSRIAIEVPCNNAGATLGSDMVLREYRGDQLIIGSEPTLVPISRCYGINVEEVVDVIMPKLDYHVLSPTKGGPGGKLLGNGGRA